MSLILKNTINAKPATTNIYIALAFIVFPHIVLGVLDVFDVPFDVVFGVAFGVVFGVAFGVVFGIDAIRISAGTNHAGGGRLSNESQYLGVSSRQSAS
jgi:hypothetical protein